MGQSANGELSIYHWDQYLLSADRFPDARDKDCFVLRKRGVRQVWWAPLPAGDTSGWRSSDWIPHNAVVGLPNGQKVNFITTSSPWRSEDGNYTIYKWDDFFHTSNPSRIVLVKEQPGVKTEVWYLNVSKTTEEQFERAVWT